MSTGVSVNDDLLSKFNDFKLNKGDFKKSAGIKYMIFKIENDSEIIVDKIGESNGDGDYEIFRAALKESGEPRYAVYDVAFQTDDGRDQAKIVFIAWVPDTCKVKQKMVYSGSKDAIKRVLLGIATDINATDDSELDWDSCIVAKCKSK